MTDESRTLGRRLRDLREAAGLTQAELSASSGVSVSLIAKIEQGLTDDPKTSTSKKLAKALGVSLDELAGGIT